MGQELPIVPAPLVHKYLLANTLKSNAKFLLAVLSQ